VTGVQTCALPISKHIGNDKPFVFEKPNHNMSIVKNQKTQKFTANCMFMGAPKRNAVIKDMVDYLRQRNTNPHYNAEGDFFGYTSKWLDNEVARNHINLVDCIYI
jgi:erythromycin esterase-like protein